MAPEHFVDVAMPDKCPFKPNLTEAIDRTKDLSAMPPESYLPVGTLTVKGRISNVWEVIGANTMHILDDSSPLPALLAAGWAQATACNHTFENDSIVIRVHLLPHDRGRAVIPRTDASLAKRQSRLMQAIDVSPEAWQGNKPISAERTKFRTYCEDEDSLFYIFNTIPSPERGDCVVANRDSQEAIDSLLHNDYPRGCKTKLYPYQRTSAAMMIRREVEPRKSLDPRLAPIQGPTGNIMFYDHQTCQVLLERREYEEVKGGILAETMGLGKSFLLLSTILATKGHWPSIPPQYSVGLHPKRPKIASLAHMAACAAGRSNIAWKKKFDELEERGEHHEACQRYLRDNAARYAIPSPEKRHSRRGTSSKPREIVLCSATVIVVPQNLIAHWLREIARHFAKNTFRVLVFDSKDSALPETRVLMNTDILLFSRQRFEHELCPQGVQRDEKEGCNCQVTQTCSCSLDADYHSPLLDLHFLRAVLDEGHEFASGRRNNMYFALARLAVDRKWLLSGTPTSGLMGVEIDKAARPDSSSQELLEARKKDISFLLECKDLENIHALITKFLNVKPWSNTKSEDPASWRSYIMPGEDGRRKPASLRCLLNSLCVRHRIEDIEKDVSLPPLHNKTVYLDPSWHDKLSQNAFLCTLISNAVTSNRCDEDYMFHPKNRMVLHTLFNNLRQSGFYWTGFTYTEMSKMMELSQTYLTDNEGKVLSSDRSLLNQAVQCVQTILSSKSWRRFSDVHEMGLWVDNLPLDCRKAWSLIPGDEKNPVLMGATQINQAQTWIFGHLNEDNDKMLLNFKARGEAVMEQIRKELYRSQQIEMDRPEQTSPKEDRKGKRYGRRSCISEPKLSEVRTVSKAKAVIGTQRRPNDKDSKAVFPGPPTFMPKSVLKSNANTVEYLDATSELKPCTLIGSASAKLTYLLDRIHAVYQDEKSLVFYEGDHIAYYIAQALDIIGVRYLIYSRSLDLALKSAYIATFNAKPTFRVMLMDLKEAAAGLHLASASRIWFLNVCSSPVSEAQAIKRAHRIGQTRPVYCETLVLRNTMEDQILKRRQEMSAQEHQDASKSLLDDRIMRGALENATLLPFSLEELDNEDSHIAKLQMPIPVFTKPVSESIDPTNPYADMIFPIETSKTKKLGIRKSTEEELHSEIEAPYASQGDILEREDHANPEEEEGKQKPLDSNSSKSVDSSGPMKKRKRVGFAAVFDQEKFSLDGDQSHAAIEAEASSSAARRVRFDSTGPSPTRQSLFGNGI